MYTIWGNQYCKRCAKYKKSFEEKGIEYIEPDLNGDVLYLLWRLGYKDLATELYGMLQWQERDLPVVTENNQAISWKELGKRLAEM